MKLFYILCLLVLTSCSHKPLYNIGDCLKFFTWSSKIATFEIVSIDNEKYRMEMYLDSNSKIKETYIENIRVVDNKDYFNKVECRK